MIQQDIVTVSDFSKSGLETCFKENVQNQQTLFKDHCEILTLTYDHLAKGHNCNVLFTVWFFILYINVVYIRTKFKILLDI